MEERGVEYRKVPVRDSSLISISIYNYLKRKEKIADNCDIMYSKMVSANNNFAVYYFHKSYSCCIAFCACRWPRQWKCCRYDPHCSQGLKKVIFDWVGLGDDVEDYPTCADREWCCWLSSIIRPISYCVWSLDDRRSVKEMADRHDDRISFVDVDAKMTWRPRMLARRDVLVPSSDIWVGMSWFLSARRCASVVVAMTLRLSVTSWCYCVQTAERIEFAVA